MYHVGGVLYTNIASYFTAIKYFSLTAGKWTDMIQFTIPESGIYEISWDAEFSSGSGSYIEGTRIRFNSDADMQYVHMSVPNQISAHSYHVANTCTKGDVVRIQIYAAVARNITNQKVVLRKIASELN